MSKGEEPDLYAPLLQAFKVKRQTDWPVAAFTWLGDGGTRDALYRLRADPVHLRADRDALVLMDAGQLSIEAREAAELIGELNAHFESDGLRFAAPVPQRWYVTVEGVPQVATWPLEYATGRSIDPLLPSGAAALRWHGYHNEIQMVLHAHPVNVRREETGEPPINSVWFWGGGVLSDEIHAEAAMVWSNDAAARGLAIATGIPCQPVPRDFPTAFRNFPPGENLLWLEASQHDPAALDRDWFTPLLDALRKRKIAVATVHITGAEDSASFALTPADRWKFWRRSALAASS
jgi:hypothetical protein